eukprot:CAMPEP_0206444944 /NCGR_PEP_ID=MMETSP0324_2-20121206/15202_1 /ASSEMBLY_ACC=CAM_ASM_000836 /TAXON_ID=2866 /ORGANISM="Crypthecodinium cohnii, Strain Seligo" /LENGTH=515 /DNA_ID=CAMNT_0053913041 /DNA_START=70 /DNA_END=1617 /DNA_ORIENTATION=-
MDATLKKPPASNRSYTGSTTSGTASPVALTARSHSYRRPQDDGVPAGCQSSRIAGRHGEMGDCAVDAHAVGSPLIKCSRTNFDPRGIHKLNELGVHNFKAHCRRNSKLQPASSGLVGQVAGSKLPYDTDSVQGSNTQRSYFDDSYKKTPRPVDEGIPAGCVSSRIAGRHGEMGDHAVDMHAVGSPLHKSARSNLDPRGHHKLTRHNPRASVMGGSERQLGASSGMVGERADTFQFVNLDGSTGQTPTNYRSVKSLHEEGIPAGCFMGRIAGRHGEMGDHGIDAHCNNSSLHHSSRSNLHPEGHPKMKDMGLATTRAGYRRNSKMMAASSGLVGQAAGSRLPWDQESSSGSVLRGSQSAHVLPSARPKDEGVPAGCVSGRIAGRHGEQGDYAVDAHAVGSSLHKSARSNLDPRDHGKLTRHNPRASVLAGSQPALGASSGLPGDRTGATYFGHEEPKSTFNPAPRAGRRNSHAGSTVSSNATGMPFSRSRCEEVTEHTRTLIKGHLSGMQATVKAN